MLDHLIVILLYLLWYVSLLLPPPRWKWNHMSLMIKCVMSVMVYIAVVDMPLTSVATFTVYVTTVNTAGLPSILPQEPKTIAVSSKKTEIAPVQSTSSLLSATVWVFTRKLSQQYDCWHLVYYRIYAKTSKISGYAQPKKKHYFSLTRIKQPMPPNHTPENYFLYSLFYLLFSVPSATRFMN